ncbi:TetR family transcriptional regulator [Leptospira kanakyensis]|uniref:TetR family transcriptional regulator n=1 Tax=Leptospira kanakyensis TaxID=2484968 RepID=A0A6N4QCG8_9LEPT|nr:TetR family transcriptional regulator [Leptospira kanakyensis]MCW7468762.1 TetR family transcriptional regulator [Leptospira kanakyensis]TGK49990.1 TetR family transcriptional regulator [Leptospira kanakyensis]TGK58493.1 TetR family transcriptional regulator [Leptospira kanakyensis]TGK69128.1 TetR family transcriptional regulator [Leptospira kanakyensis]
MKLNKRYAQKLRTHDNLLESALQLMGEEKGLGDLSLREVAGEAGIVPAAFYRHFKNMEELGLSLVDECGGRIQTIVGDARNKGAYKSALQLTIGFFFDYVTHNRSLFRFISRERTGGNRKIREKIRESMNAIAVELAKDMRMPKMIPQLDIQFASELIVSICFLMASDYLDLATDAHSEMRKIKLQTIKQVRLVFIGTIRGRKKR